MDYSDFLQLEKEVPEKATKTKKIEPYTKRVPSPNRKYLKACMSITKLNFVSITLHLRT